MKKAGKYLLCFLPLLIYVVIQLAGGIGVSIIAGFRVAAANPGADMITMQQQAMELYLDMVPMTICAIHVIMTVTGTIWFYLALGRKRRGKPEKTFTWLTIVVIVFCAIGIQYVCTGALMFVQAVAPGALDSYSQLIQNAGLGGQDFFSVIAAVCLAPFGEEFLFRGITMNFAKKAGAGFLVANIIQALCFGIAHMNLVQGIYAFFMGIIFGYIYERYHSIYVPVLLHAAVNFLATFINPLLLEKIFGEAEPEVLSSIVFLIVAAAALAVGFVLLNKDRKKEEEFTIK